MAGRSADSVAGRGGGSAIAGDLAGSHGPIDGARSSGDGVGEAAAAAAARAAAEHERRFVAEAAAQSGHAHELARELREAQAAAMGYGIDASRAQENEAKLMAAHAASAARERALQQELSRSQAAAMGYGIDYEKAHDHERQLLAEAAAGAAKARALQRDLADARGHLIGTSIDFERSHEHEKQAIAEAAAQAARARQYKHDLASARAAAMGYGIDASRAQENEAKLMAAHAAAAARERSLQQELARAKAAAMGYGIDYEKAHDHERQLMASDAAKAARVRALERDLADARGHLIGTSIDFERSHEHEKQAIAEAAAQAARARQYKHDLASARAAAMGYGIDASRAQENEAKLMAAHAAAAARERALQQELARAKAAAMGYGIDYEKAHDHEAQLVAHAAADAARIRSLEQELKQSNARAMGLGIDYHRAHKNEHGLLAEAAAAKSRARAAARRYVEGLWHSLCLELERGSWPHVTLVRGKVNDAMQTLMTDATFVSQLGRQFKELAGADEMVRRDDDSLRAMVTDLRKFFLRRIFHDDPSLQTALADRASDPSRARRMLRQSLDALAKARPADLDAIVQALMEDCGALDDDVVTFEEFCRIAGALFLAAVRPDICPSDLVAVSRANFARARRAGGLLAPGYVEAVAEWLSEDVTRDYWASLKISGENKEAAHRFFLRVPDLREFLGAFDQHDSSDDSGSLPAAEVPQLLASNLQVFAQRLRDDTRGNCTRLAFTIADDVPAEVVAQEPIKAGAASVAAASGSGKGGAGGSADGVAGDGRRLAAAAREMRSRADLFMSASSKSKTDLVGMVLQDVDGSKSKVSRSEFVRLTLALALAVARHDLLSGDSAARKVLGERGDFLTAGDGAAAGGAADKRG